VHPLVLGKSVVEVASSNSLKRQEITMPTPLHIGIVACSAEGAALCYRTICSEGAALLGPHAHPEISMHTPSFAEYVRCLEEHDVEGIGKLMAASAEKLARAGADFLICPDNTIHEAFAIAAANSPLPWLHIAAVAAAEARARGYARLGLTGTHWLVASNVYPEQLGRYDIECIRPIARDRDEIGRIIMDELVYGIVKPDSVAYCLGVIAKLRDGGCDAVVLGCTELPLIIDDNNSPLPTLDSTRLLARAALQRAIGGSVDPR
jgi:aspartate racemase